MTLETWLPVVGYEGLYEVSDLGAVRSIPRVDSAGARRRGYLLSQPLRSTRKYPSVTLSRAGRVAQKYVHTLVLEAFVGSCPPGMEALHGNDVAHDNRLTNLRWGTYSENWYDSIRNGMVRKKRMKRTTKPVEETKTTFTVTAKKADS